MTALPPFQERTAIAICTNDVSGRSTPAAVSYDGKLRHVGVTWAAEPELDVRCSVKVLE